MCFARSNTWPCFVSGLVQNSGWFGQVQVHLKSLLVVIIVISSQLLQEASKRLCRLGAVGEVILFFSEEIKNGKKELAAQ